MGNKKNNVNFVYDKKNNKVVKKTATTRKNTKKKLVNEELENELSKTTNLSKKDISRRKYNTRQKRYNQGSKKKVLDLDITIVTNDYLNLEQAEKQSEKKVEEKKLLEPLENNLEVKKSRKKEIVKKIVVSKEKKKFKWIKKPSLALEEDIPLTSDKASNRLRIKRYLKEAIVFSIIITIINILSTFIFKNVNVLNLFDVSILNILITIVLSLIISYIISFFSDCLITEIWIKIKNKKEGEKHANSGIKQGEYQEDIQIKE